jgi:hypothetical protein
LTYARAITTSINNQVFEVLSQMKVMTSLNQQTVSSDQVSTEAAISDLRLGVGIHFDQVPDREMSESLATAPRPNILQSGGHIQEPRVFSPHKCNIHCSCACHAQFRNRSPTFLDRVIGILALEHSKAVTGQVVCTEKSCRAVSRFHLAFHYHPPSWLFARAISLILSDAFYQGSITTSLVVRRIIPPEHEVFRLVQAGDTAGVQRLLTTRAVAPNDLHATACWTSLHVSSINAHTQE